MLAMRYIAYRQDSAQQDIAVIECQENENITSPEEFLKRLKNAITEWIETTERGNKAWEDSSEDFNFGDLALYFDDTSLKLYLFRQEIFGLNVYTITTQNFDFDEILVNED